ncbi:MAG TPA: hypothetical protein VNO31_35015, partial [Umezawaea sp.]|nr:hypothetical protein [Umezawaea sp.]
QVKCHRLLRMAHLVEFSAQLCRFTVVARPVQLAVSVSARSPHSHHLALRAKRIIEVSHLFEAGTELCSELARSGR